MNAMKERNLITHYFTAVTTLQQTRAPKTKTQSEKQLWTRCSMDLLFLCLNFLLPRDKCIGRTACRYWYECSKLPIAQTMMWRYPIRLRFGFSYRHEGQLDSMTVASESLCLAAESPEHLASESAETITVVPIESLERSLGPKRKRKQMPHKLKEVKFDLLRDDDLRHVFADANDSLVAHQSGVHVHILDFSACFYAPFRGVVATVVRVFTFPKGNYTCALCQRQLFVVFFDHADIYELDGQLVQSWSFDAIGQKGFQCVSVYDKKIYLLDYGRPSRDHLRVFSFEGKLLHQWKIPCSDTDRIAVNGTGIYVLNDLENQVAVFTHEGIFVCDVQIPSSPKRIFQHCDCLVLTNQSALVGSNLKSNYEICQFDIVFENPRNVLLDAK